MSVQPLRPATRRVTLTDVARGCGVSRATVSLVLRGTDDARLVAAVAELMATIRAMNGEAEEFLT